MYLLNLILENLLLNWIAEKRSRSQIAQVFLEHFGFCQNTHVAEFLEKSITISSHQFCLNDKKIRKRQTQTKSTNNILLVRKYALQCDFFCGRCHQPISEYQHDFGEKITLFKCSKSHDYISPIRICTEQICTRALVQIPKFQTVNQLGTISTAQTIDIVLKSLSVPRANHRYRTTIPIVQVNQSVKLSGNWSTYWLMLQLHLYMFQKWANPGLFSVYLCSFQKQILQKKLQASAGFELGSLKKNSSTLTTTTLPTTILFC